MRTVFICVFTIFLLTSCGKKQDEQQSTIDNAIADSVESAVTALAGASDEQANENMASIEKGRIRNLLNILTPLPSAYAAVCSGRAFGQTCNSGVKSISYTDCNIGLTAHKLNGSVSLSYSDTSDCDIDTNGETVTRNYDVTRTTPWGANLRTFSSSHTNYEGTNLSGGGRLTKTASGYNLDILGKHRTRTSAGGRSRLDISMSTGSSITLNQISRNGRVFDGGSLVIYHNLAKYKVTLIPNNLTYSSACCYPVGGTLDLTYSGNVSGTGSVSFTSCGQATVSRDSDSYDIEFYSCE